MTKTNVSSARKGSINSVGKCLFLVDFTGVGKLPIKVAIEGLTSIQVGKSLVVSIAIKTILLV